MNRPPRARPQRLLPATVGLCVLVGVGWFVATEPGPRWGAAEAAADGPLSRPGGAGSGAPALDTDRAGAAAAPDGARAPDPPRRRRTDEAKRDASQPSARVGPVPGSDSAPRAGEASPAAERAQRSGDACALPDLPVPRTPGCGRGDPYPECQWRIPHPAVAGYLYSRWRNTSSAQWWGRPALVSVALAAAQAYAQRYPGETLAIGDLDAPGPRHETHDEGIDVDLYLPGMMASENEGGGDYPNNYSRRPHLAVRAMRGRVEELARILARCTQGRLLIYYNDPVVAGRFVRWYRKQGFDAPFGLPMRKHNELHRFHFHVRIAADVPLPAKVR